MLKSISKFILYAGAVFCALAGFGATYIVVDSFTASDFDPGELVVFAIYTCLSFTPAIMFLTGLKTKTWQWVSIATVEVIVLAPAFCELFALIELAEGKIAI